MKFSKSNGYSLDGIIGSGHSIKINNKLIEKVIWSGHIIKINNKLIEKIEVMWGKRYCQSHASNFRVQEKVRLVNYILGSFGVVFLYGLFKGVSPNAMLRGWWICFTDMLKAISSLVGHLYSFITTTCT
jgi:hypothetical protein